MKQLNWTIAGIATIVVLQAVPVISTARAQNTDQPETRQAQAVSRSVFQSIEKAQAFIDADDCNGAIALLKPLTESDRLSEYELANVYRYVGFCHHSLANTAAAIESFGKILKIESIEVPLRKTTLYTLAQLHAMNDQYERSLELIEQWFALESNPAPSALIFHAQILYQLNRHSALIESVEQALIVAATRSIEPKENWYVLLSYAYFQQENYGKVRDISVLLLERWPKKRYWLSLANAYRELGDEEKFIATYDVANLQGFLISEAELVTLAQLYLQGDIPYKAATLLDEEMSRHRIGKSGSNYRLLSQAWSLAQESRNSIEPLQLAADLDDNGDLFVRLGNAYLDLGEYGNCVTAIETGLARGKLRAPDYAHVSMGMCLYSAREFQRALKAFRVAAKTPRSRQTANQWINVILSEIKRVEAIFIAEAHADERFKALAARKSADDST